MHVASQVCGNHLETETIPDFLFADMFAGIGGIRLGFEQAFGNNVMTTFVAELDENAQKTYVANFGKNLSYKVILQKFLRMIYLCLIFVLQVFRARLFR